MKPIEEKVVKVIGVVGWILVGLGGIFTTWLLVRGFSEGMKEPMIMLFLITLIFCSVAVGMFFVVLNIIVNLMIRIANNTNRKAN
jgi:uncharacterized membrane protein